MVVELSQQLHALIGSAYSSAAIVALFPSLLLSSFLASLFLGLHSDTWVFVIGTCGEVHSVKPNHPEFSTLFRSVLVAFAELLGRLYVKFHTNFIIMSKSFPEGSRLLLPGNAVPSRNYKNNSKPTPWLFTETECTMIPN